MAYSSMTNSQLPWEKFGLEAGEVFAAVAVPDCTGLKWVKTADTRVGIAIDLPGDMSPFDPGRAYQNLEFEVLPLSEGANPLKIFCVFCVDSSYFEIFEDLCRSLIKVLKDIDDPISKAKTTVTRANAWSELFRSGRRELSREQVMGLICELNFLKDHWKPMGRGISTWYGPDDKSQDFVDDGAAVAVEIKHQSKEGAISISSLYQLDFDGALFLVTMQLEEHAEGISLNALVEEISCDLNPEELADFESKLIRLGYEARSTYDVPFRTADKKCLAVKSDFPRLVVGSVTGLVRANYKLQLDDSFDPYIISIADMEVAFER